MSTNYNGDKKAAEAPASAPAPGLVPTVVVPADNDPLNVATCWTQQYKMFADYIAYIQASAGLSPPYTAADGTGFSAVTHTGSGVGTTVTPSSSVKINTGTNFVIQIIVGGATGVATFETSIDGGTTYGATQTTSASMTDSTSGITLAFSGTFVALDTYQFNSALTPLVTYAQADGYIRHLTDHNGYRMGRVTEVNQNWQGANNGISSGLPSLPHSVNNFIDGYGWFSKVVGTNTSYGIFTGDPTDGVAANNFGFMGLASQQAFLASSFSSGDHNIIATTNPILTPQNNTLLVAEWEMCLSMAAIADTKLIWQIGLTNNTSNTSLSSDSEMLFEQITTDTTWFIRTANGSSSTRTSSGVAIDVATAQRFRMEYYGKNTNNGTAYAKFFINESLVLATTSTLPQINTSTAHSLFWVQRGHYVTGTCPYQVMMVGPIRIVYSRYLNNPAL